MTTNDHVTIELTSGERQTLLHLLTEYIHPRVWEAARSARNSTDLQRAAAMTRRVEGHDLAH